jgi:hypothetical protein
MSASRGQRRVEREEREMVPKKRKTKEKNEQTEKNYL